MDESRNILRMSQVPVVTRFAPSPTGELHLGNARTALFNYLLAQRHGGRFVLRVEDTDAARSSEQHIAALVADLQWLGLRWDTGPGAANPEHAWRQALRGDIYGPCYEQLIARGAAYPCYCTATELDLSRRAQLASGRPPRYAGTCRKLDEAGRTQRLAAGRKPALRFAVPAGQVIEFEDAVHGPQRVISDEIGDFIIRRDDGSSAFFFCNAIDDAEMGITHLLRGEDHLSNTPRQLLLLAALGMRAPSYGHVSLLTGDDGSPLSKRHGATSVRELREAGYGANAICNLLFRLGHSTPDTGLLTLPQMAAGFEVAHLQRASAHFDPVQLRHWQRAWLQSLDAAQARDWLLQWLPPSADDSSLETLLAAIRPNVVLASDVREWYAILRGDSLTIDGEAAEVIRSAGAGFFAAAASAAASPERALDAAALRTATGTKGAAFFRPLRAALTGQLHGPEIDPLLRALGAERIRDRLAACAEALPSAPQ